jgi:hypothetical protein
MADGQAGRRAEGLWLSGLVLGALIHVDWHLARPGSHHELSFGLTWHWLLGVPAFLAVYLVARRWRPERPLGAALKIVLIGVLAGQVLEPLGEVLLSGSWEWALLPIRWRAFAEFLAAGLVTLGVLFAIHFYRKPTWTPSS